MSKKKEYLPLRWVKKLEDNLTYGSLSKMTMEDLEAFTRLDDTDKAYNSLIKFPELLTLFKMASENPDMVLQTGDTVDRTLKETLSDFDAIYTVKKWAYNKQVFKFDMDFLNELVRTENVRLTKDIFKFLPFPCFYVDISDNEEVCKEIFCQGFFVYVDNHLIDNKEHWRIHAVKLTDEYFFNDIFIIENADIEQDLSEITDIREVELVKSDLEKNILHTVSHKKINSKLYQLVVFQILVYLSSAEPQIEENAVTKETYRKPTAGAKPKNRFSEIQAHDVGVRFGSAFRKYKKMYQDKNTEKSESLPSGRTVRPHSRRAHYSHRWYGKRDSEDRVLRPVWIEATFVGVHNNDKSDTVIHKVQHLLEEEH